MDNVSSNISGDPGGSPAPGAVSGAGMPSSQGAGAPSQGATLPSGAGEFDGENLLQMSRGIFGEGHEDDPLMPGQDPAQSEGETPAEPEAEPLALPQLREHTKALESDLNNWKQLGTFEQAQSDINLVNSLYSENPRDFWEQLRGQTDAGLDTVADVLGAAIERWPDFFVSALQQNGLIPQASLDEILAIPPEHREMYNRLSPEEKQVIWAAPDDQTANQLLEAHQKSFERDQTLAKHDQQLREAQEQQRQQQTAQLGQNIREAVKQGIMASLGEKLKPTGDGQTDSQLGEVAWTWAERAVTEDPAAQGALAAVWKAIDQGDARKAMSLVAPLQAYAARKIGEFLDRLGPVFTNHHNYIKSQRAAGANRVEAPFPGGNLPQGQGNRQLPPNAGEFDPENIRRMSRDIFG